MLPISQSKEFHQFPFACASAHFGDAILDFEEEGLHRYCGFVVNACPKRQTEFLAGRACAHFALELLPNVISYSKSVVGCRINGSPEWPRDIVGSITHTDGYAAAAVAISGHVQGVGIDAEDLASFINIESIATLFGDSAEFNILQESNTAALGLMKGAMFSAKESIFKCLFPLVRLSFDFKTARLVELDCVQRVMRFDISELNIGHTLQNIIEVRYNIDNTRVYTWTII